MALLLAGGSATGQVTTPTVRALFGVDGDVQANVIAGTNTDNDDWFINSNCCGSRHVIDTNGAASWINLYHTNSQARRRSFVKKMSMPVYTISGNRLWYDAIMVRDHHAQDTTSFNTSNKNTQSPAVWTGGTQPLPMKDDIKDVMVTVRRDGPNFTYPLFFLAGISLEGNTGNRYFDFELYQTDMTYDPASGKFNNYGLDSGHTAWRFDASGNVIQAGDIIFTAEFGSSSLSGLEARIWIHEDSRGITPTAFNWGGTYDSDMGTRFGYASILPKASVNFYAGTQSTAGTWAGPFGSVSFSGGVNANYNSGQFMEIAVDLTAIGLDPYVLTSITNTCGLPFKRLFAKTRAATAFTAELKDFIGPYSFGQPEITSASPDISMFCGLSYQVSNLSVNNPVATSLYNWTTTDGNIITYPAQGETISVDREGTYVVTQTLFSGCAPYSRDTVVVGRMIACMLLEQRDGFSRNAATKEGIRLGPNPAMDHLLLQLPSSLRQAYVRMYDASGKLVYQQAVSGSHSKINVAHLPFGIYFLKLDAANGYQSTHRVLKQ